MLNLKGSKSSKVLKEPADWHAKFTRLRVN